MITTHHQSYYIANNQRQSTINFFGKEQTKVTLTDLINEKIQRKRSLKTSP